MKMKIARFAYLPLAFFLLFAASCRKEDSVKTEPLSSADAQMISEENATAENEQQDVTEMGFATGSDLEVIAGANGADSTGETTAHIDFRLSLFANLVLKLGPNATIQVVPSDGTYPKTVTIDYGAGTLCRDGRTRQGSVVLQFSGPMRQSGSELTIQLNNYMVNNVKIAGTKTIRNLSADGVIKYSVTVEGGSVQFANGRGFTFSENKIRTKVAGMATSDVSDDVFSIEGSTMVKYANGVTVTRTTETPLIKPVACRWIVQGIMKVQINERIHSIDFGDGTYDNLAVVTTANGSFQIKLP